ncbi:MAG: hypothetical protein FRX49_04638 [Trebouxia sp. A1-2]|nr:MAG: hypothetical protein FRX49_04638 [Trebouxia sp. A1-2]
MGAAGPELVEDPMTAELAALALICTALASAFGGTLPRASLWRRAVSSTKHSLVTAVVRAGDAVTGSGLSSRALASHAAMAGSSRGGGGRLGVRRPDLCLLADLTVLPDVCCGSEAVASAVSACSSALTGGGVGTEASSNRGRRPAAGNGVTTGACTREVKDSSAAGCRAGGARATAEALKRLLAFLSLEEEDRAEEEGLDAKALRRRNGEGEGTKPGSRMDMDSRASRYLASWLSRMTPLLALSSDSACTEETFRGTSSFD